MACATATMCKCSAHSATVLISGAELLRSPLHETQSSAAAEQVIAEGHRAFREAVDPAGAAARIYKLLAMKHKRENRAERTRRARQAAPFMG